VNLSLVVAPNTTGSSLLSYTARNSQYIETVNHSADFIRNTTVEYTHINRRVNTSNSQVVIRCWQGSALGNYLPALAFSEGRLVVYQIRPFSEVNNYGPTNNSLLDCQATSLRVANGLTCSTSYAVQYQVGTGTTWINHLNYARRSGTFSFNRSDFAGLDIGESLRLRLQYNNPGTGSPTYSDILTYSYGVCSPNTASFSTEPTTCSNTTDGGFTLNFDRVLNTGETLSMVLRRDNPTGPIISTPTGVSYTGTTYIWPDDLPAANYYLRYQTEPTGNAVDVGPIAVTSPSVVTFTAGWTDVDCFGENTGSISIDDVSGGNGNYEYSINNGTDWVAFGSAASHMVTNLVAGNYQVKVRDANNCVAQN